MLRIPLQRLQHIRARPALEGLVARWGHTSEGQQVLCQLCALQMRQIRAVSLQYLQ